MSRVLKKIILLLVAAAALACLGLAAACEGPGDGRVTVTLIGEDLEETPVRALPGEPLPVLETEDKDFEGYWTDEAYTQRYEGETVPSGDVTLYYKLNPQYYTLVLDYGENGTLSFTLERGKEEELPSVSPAGTTVAGFADTPKGTAVYLAGTTVFNLAPKDGTVTLYARTETADAENFIIENGVLVGYVGEADSLVLPLGATVVAPGAFADSPARDSIRSVTVPATYTSLGCGAFEGLTSVESLTLPFIGGSRTQNRFLSYLFGAEKYTDNDYSFAAYSDGSNLYIGDEDFDSLLIPATLRTVRVTERTGDIAEGAFYSAYSLENLILDYPEALTAVGDSAFENCYSFGYDSVLGVAICPEWLSYVKTIGDRAFKSYTGNTESEITEVSTSTGTAELLVNEYPHNLLMNMPALTNVETIGAEAFYFCAFLSDLTFGDKLVSIGESAFVYTLSLSNLRFPDSLEEIGDFAFQGCGEYLIEFGTGIGQIGVMAFAENSELKDIVFTSANVPVLRGGQCFSNTLEQNISEDWNIILNDDFCVYVPEGAEEGFLDAPDWDEYKAYFCYQGAKRGDAYWSADGEGFDASFEFISDSILMVTDPAQAFISYIDDAADSMTYGVTAGTYYPLMYEILGDDEYAALAGDHAKALYDNETVLRVWHPALLDKNGEMREDIYLRMTVLPYTAGEGRVLVPVIEVAAGGALYGDAAVDGSYVISFNNFGAAYVLSVGSNGSSPVSDPEGTYYARTQENASRTGFAVTYYNDNFDVIGSAEYIRDGGADDAKAPLYAKTEDIALRTDPSANDGVELFLNGSGKAQISFVSGGKQHEYLADAAKEGALSFGDEGYTLAFTGFTEGGTPAGSLTGKAVFYGFDGENYARIDLSVAGFAYMIVNAAAYEEEQYLSITSSKVVMPHYSAYTEDWRFEKLSDTETDGAFVLFRLASGILFREYDGEGRLISFGSAQESESGFTFLAAGTIAYGADGAPSFTAGETSRTAAESGDGFTVGEKAYTFYDKERDMTLVYTDGSYYYYTVKADGLGNMYIADETSYFEKEYIGKYVLNGAFEANGTRFTELLFTGSEAGISSAEEVTFWIVYVEDIMQVWENEPAFAPYYGTLTAISADYDETNIVVNDGFGNKKYEVTVSVYGVASYVQYESTIGRDGSVSYTELAEGDVAYFEPVFNDDDTVAFCVAVGEKDRVLFSIRPEEEGSDQYVIVRDGGQTLAAGQDVEVSFDLASMETLPAGGASFGTLA